VGAEFSADRIRLPDAGRRQNIRRFRIDPTSPQPTGQTPLKGTMLRGTPPGLYRCRHRETAREADRL